MSLYEIVVWPISVIWIPLVALSMLGKIEDRTYWGSITISNAVLSVIDLFHGEVTGSAICGVGAAISFYFWWKSRRNGRWKRAAKELGAKSKARVDALVEQLTPSPIPSPAGAR